MTEYLILPKLAGMQPTGRISALIPKIMQYLPGFFHLGRFHQNVKVPGMPPGYITIKLESQKRSF